MIVPTMNFEEISKEIFSEHDIVMRKSQHLLKDLRRIAIKKRKKSIQKIYDYTSKNNNNWLIFINYYALDPTWITVVYFINDWGFNAIMTHADKRTLIHYSSHFLDRYNERYLKLENPTKVDLLKNFISKNPQSGVSFVPDSDKYKSAFFARFREGIGLGHAKLVANKQILFYKTYIAEEMIFKSQVGDFNYASNIYENYWNEVYKGYSQGAYDKQ